MSSAKQFLVDQAGRGIILRENGLIVRQFPTDGSNPRLEWRYVDLKGIEGQVDFIAVNPTQQSNLVVLTDEGMVYEQYRGAYQPISAPLKWRQAEEPKDVGP